jgi:trimethylamine---corrinoid protein Co-methyltransferase
MGFNRNIPRYKILKNYELDIINEYSFKILKEIGVKVPHDKILDIINSNGAKVDKKNFIVKLDEEIVNRAINIASKKHILYGRDKNKKAEFGYGMYNFQGSAGQYQILDYKANKRRSPVLSDLIEAIKIGDGLENINIVGALVIPMDVAVKVVDIVIFYLLLTMTTKPFYGWVFSGENAKKIIKMMEIVAGGKEKLKQYPFFEILIEPISPLTFRKESLDILLEFANADLPVCITPMVQIGATGPCSLIGTIAQENAEILAGITIAQMIKPGLPVTYGGVPHFFALKAQMISFGSPEQGVMGAAMTQLGKYYGFPVRTNTSLSDSKCIDAQYGIEASGTLSLAMLSGSDINGELGIIGADNAVSLTQLIIDNELASYHTKISEGLKINEIEEAYIGIFNQGIGGNFFMDDLTLKNYKKSFWYPELFDRLPWDAWIKERKRSVLEKARVKQKRLLKQYKKFSLNKETIEELNSYMESNSIDIDKLVII